MELLPAIAIDGDGVQSYILVVLACTKAMLTSATYIVMLQLADAGQ